MKKPDNAGNRKLLQTRRLPQPWRIAGLSTVLFCLLATSVFAQSPPVIWSNKITSGLFFADHSGGIALDQQDNFFVYSEFNSYFGPLVTIGNQTLTNRGSMYNGLISNFSKNGDFLWVQQIGGTYEDYPLACATDAGGNVFVTGILGSTNMVIGSTVLTNALQIGTETCFLAKYDPQGNALWACQSLSTVLPGVGFAWDYGTSVAVDADGNAWLAGTFISSNIFFGTNMLVNPGYIGPNSANSSQDFLVKYSGAGDVLWARLITAASDPYPTIGVDTNGNGLLCASFSGSAVAGPITVTNVFGGTEALMLAKFDSDGNVLWAEMAAHSVSNIYLFPGPIAVDLQGNSWISGSGGAAFATNAVAPPGSGAATGFVAKFDQSGNFLWAAVPTNETYPSASVDAVGNGYVFDRYNIVKYASNGTVLWSTNVLAQSGGAVRAAADAAGTLFLLGENDPWSGYVVAELSGPYLNIQPSGNQAIISWPTNEVGLSLGSASSLSGPWSPATNPPPAVIGNQYFVTNDVSAGSQFFRLGNF
jgi:hypothetical protein